MRHFSASHKKYHKNSFCARVKAIAISIGIDYNKIELWIAVIFWKENMARNRRDDRNGENVEDEEPNFDDPEDFVDDISEQGAYKREKNWTLIQYCE